MKALILVLLLGSQIFGSVSASEAKIKRSDLQMLTGAWSGTLTYLDYRSQKKVSIPANLNVRPNGEDKWSWIFEYEYPDEPHANSREVVKLSKDGDSINGEVVVERMSMPGNTVRLVTEKRGEDNNRRAYFRFTYLVNAKSFSIRKEVRYEAENQFFERNEYSWKR
ncbi:MAG TPA: hypothetical protein VFI24_20620 [Pyrinomonadaceae bacterium]|nr:hypothetical protein [Pyrinomonadaceae bacterium]